MMIKRIPKRFYDDCRDCETPVPARVRETSTHYFVDTDVSEDEVFTAEETMDDFISRAVYYADEQGFDTSPFIRGICKSAAATLRALHPLLVGPFADITQQLLRRGIIERSHNHDTQHDTTKAKDLRFEPSHEAQVKARLPQPELLPTARTPEGDQQHQDCAASLAEGVPRHGP